MKKVFVLFLLAALLVSPVFAVPSDDDVAAAFSGVFGVYGAIFFSALAGQEVKGAVMDMDMNTGASSLTFDNLDTAALFASIGESLDGSGGIPPITFTHISGYFNADADGNLDMNVTFKGCPVKQLEMRTEGDDLVILNADGQNFMHLEVLLMDTES